MQMSAGLQSQRRCHPPRCAAILTLLPDSAWRHIPPPYRPQGHFPPRFRCKLTRSSDHDQQAHPLAVPTHPSRHSRALQYLPTTQLLRQMLPQLSPCLLQQCGSARCARTPTSSASPLWRWPCAGEASSTTVGQDGRDGRFLRGSRLQSPMRLALTVFRHGGFPLATD